jgi:hypothetical protein
MRLICEICAIGGSWALSRSTFRLAATGRGINATVSHSFAPTPGLFIVTSCAADVSLNAPSLRFFPAGTGTFRNIASRDAIEASGCPAPVSAQPGFFGRHPARVLSHCAVLWGMGQSMAIGECRRARRGTEPSPLPSPGVSCQGEFPQTLPPRGLSKCTRWERTLSVLCVSAVNQLIHVLMTSAASASANSSSASCCMRHRT